MIYWSRARGHGVWVDAWSSNGMLKARIGAGMGRKLRWRIERLSRAYMLRVQDDGDWQ